MVSRPRPQSATRLPSSSENFTYRADQLVRDVVVLAEREVASSLASVTGRCASTSVGEAADDRVVAPLRAARSSRSDRGQALVDLPHALERLLAAGRGQQREAVVLVRVGEQVRAEDLRSAARAS